MHRGAQNPVRTRHGDPEGGWSGRQDGGLRSSSNTGPGPQLQPELTPLPGTPIAAPRSAPAPGPRALVTVPRGARPPTPSLLRKHLGRQASGSFCQGRAYPQTRLLR